MQEAFILPELAHSEDSRIAVYVRVSTADQNLDRQLEAAHEYAESTFDCELKDIITFRDKSTGTDTARSGYKDLLEEVESGGY